jgi:hypothetical protein
MASPPRLTDEQRAAALAKAAEVRTARAAVKARIKNHSLSLNDVLSSEDPNVVGIKVLSILESLPKVGKVKARRLMDDIGIAHNRRIQGLGAQQREALLKEFGV